MAVSLVRELISGIERAEDSPRSNCRERTMRIFVKISMTVLKLLPDLK